MWCFRMSPSWNGDCPLWPLLEQTIHTNTVILISEKVMTVHCDLYIRRNQCALRSLKLSEQITAHCYLYIRMGQCICEFYIHIYPNHLDKCTLANNVDPDQNTPLETIWSGSALFAHFWFAVCLSVTVFSTHHLVVRWMYPKFRLSMVRRYGVWMTMVNIEFWK